MEQEVLDQLDTPEGFQMMTDDLWICYLEPFPFIYTALTKAFLKYWNIFSEIVLIPKFILCLLYF